MSAAVGETGMRSRAMNLSPVLCLGVLLGFGFASQAEAQRTENISVSLHSELRSVDFRTLANRLAQHGIHATPASETGLRGRVMLIAIDRQGNTVMTSSRGPSFRTRRFQLSQDQTMRDLCSRMISAIRNHSVSSEVLDPWSRRPPPPQRDIAHDLLRPQVAPTRDEANASPRERASSSELLMPEGFGRQPAPAQHEGAQNEGAENNRAQNDSVQSDRAQNEQTENDGAENELASDDASADSQPEPAEASESDASHETAERLAAPPRSRETGAR